MESFLKSENPDSPGKPIGVDFNTNVNIFKKKSLSRSNVQKNSLKEYVPIIYDQMIDKIIPIDRPKTREKERYSNNVDLNQSDI